MPQLRDEVAVVGYPVGGEEISITEGVVSRIEVQRYSHSPAPPARGHGRRRDQRRQQRWSGVRRRQGRRHRVPEADRRRQHRRDGAAADHPRVPRRRREGQAPRDSGARHHDAEPREPAAAQAARPRRRERGVVVLHVDYGGSADGMLAAARRDHARSTACRSRTTAPSSTWAATARATTSCSATATSATRSSSRSSATASAQHRRARAHAVAAARAALALRPAAAVLRLRRPRVPDADARLPDDVGQVVEQGAEGVPELLLPRLPHARAARGRDPHADPRRRDQRRLRHLYNEAVATLERQACRSTWRTSSRGCRAAHGVVEITTTSGGIIMLDADEVRKATPRILARYHIPRDRTPGLPGARPAAPPLRAAMP